MENIQTEIGQEG